MSTQVQKAYFQLVRFELILARANFKALYDTVRLYSVRQQSTSRNTLSALCAAMDTACVWYWKEVLCLQRSAATTCLLRAAGFSAQMVIGAQQMPFRGHAWVEVQGTVVNDRPYVPEIYQILDRC